MLDYFSTLPLGFVCCLIFEGGSSLLSLGNESLWGSLALYIIAF